MKGKVDACDKEEEQTARENSGRVNPTTREKIVRVVYAKSDKCGLLRNGTSRQRRRPKLTAISRKCTRWRDVLQTEP
ncbi:hypothetical protein V1478_011710 [Vespula squamosa]|uniref:Uncharacterized protein n=1 Tax=Vespula squamosa TaxID=30214 RepID=A0ABD2AB57_VESSQ